MNILVCIICVTIGYFVGMHVGKNATKTSYPGILKIARDDENKVSNSYTYNTC